MNPNNNNEGGAAGEVEDAAQETSIASALAKRGDSKPKDANIERLETTSSAAGETNRDSAADLPADDDPAELKKQIAALKSRVDEFESDAVEKAGILQGKYAKADYILNRCKSEGMRKIARLIVPDTTDQSKLEKGGREAELLYKMIVDEHKQWAIAHPDFGGPVGGMNLHEYADQMKKERQQNAAASARIADSLRSRPR